MNEFKTLDLYPSWTKVWLAGLQTKALFWSHRGRLWIEASFVALANQPPDYVMYKHNGQNNTHVFSKFHIICFAALESISAGELWSTATGSSRLHTAWRGQRRLNLKNFFCYGIWPPSTGSRGICCRSKRPAAYKILLGIHTERATEASKQVRNLEKLVLGPNGADIALLKLQTWACFFLIQGFSR